MNNIQRLLYKRMEREYELFLQSVEKRSPKEIIKASYEVVYKEEILMLMQSTELSDETLRVLFKSPTPLDECFYEWMKDERSPSDDIKEVIDGIGERYLRRQAERAEAR